MTANSRLYSMIRGDDVMCQALMDLMKDEIEEREEKATEAATGMAIRKMMSSLNLTAEEAMDALEIPQDKRQIFVMYLN